MYNKKLLNLALTLVGLELKILFLSLTIFPYVRYFCHFFAKKMNTNTSLLENVSFFTLFHVCGNHGNIYALVLTIEF